ncbi:MAG: alpha/beta fold hydrolase [Ignavibacteriales bacterium]
MIRLSSPIENIKDHYEVVVVGSGYGGAIAASRLARAKRQVCVLERGKEFQPGEYPNTEPEVIREFQMDLPEGHIGSCTGLYDLRVNKDINVLLGCGLGGTSLVNANVAIRPEPRVFQDNRWPRAFRNDLNTLLEDGYRRALDMLRPLPYPEKLLKLEVLEKSANYMGEKFYPLLLNVTFEEPQSGVNHVGVEQHKCTACGDCVTGCNYGAKNTVLMNYLPDAKNHGAEIYTNVSVRHIERRDGRWVVHYQLLDSGRERFDAPTMFVTADIVILSAGTLGSTEILLRSKAAGLPLSDKIGCNFTGNGDILAFSYNPDQEVSGIGFGHHSPEGRKPVGPCITGVIDIRHEEQPLNEGMVIEEGSIPGAVAPLLPASFAKVSKLIGKDTDSGVADLIREREREVEGLVRGAYTGAIQNTQTYLVMTHDDGAGRLRLKDDRLRIDWPDVGDQPVFKRVEDRLIEATRAIGGTYVKNPAWSKVFRDSLITVHPLGGCIIAEDAEQGVVNHKGQVFSGSRGADVYDSLYVSDGSVIPLPLGVNPLLTISAVAERCCRILARDHGWGEIDYEIRPVQAQPISQAHVGIRFTETMRGYFSAKVKGDKDYERGAEQGRADGCKFEFTLTITSDDLDDMLSNPAHRARMVGTVNAPAISAQPLTVTDGEFNLFTENPDQIETRNMRYRMKMTDESGKDYCFEGFKVVRHDSRFDIWKDTTTLYITIHEGDTSDSPVMGKGILRISPEDFLRQMTTIQATNAHSPKERLEETARFGQFFAGVLYQTYGGILARPSVFNPDAPPRKKRTLRVGAPQVYFFNTEDGVQLRFTRYQGGNKGPVILSHGLGVSSLIFSIDTIETNLVEYLYAHGFDAWLLDYRASIDLPSSGTQFSADDVATKDYPAAVNKVRELTGAKGVQMVAHCYGSTTFFMAILAGLEGISSAVCSQIGTDIVVPAAAEIKSGLHVPSLLKALGVKSLNAYVDAHEKWLERLYDKALELYPIEAEERCGSSVCHRITFVYSPLYEHDQLNDDTHSALHEIFGIANIKSFEHLALLIRKRKLVNARGEDVYMPHIERLAIPITFIHGAENRYFLPESTEKTLDLLSEKNGKDLYSRHVIPNYGHADCIFGKNAVKDVYPFILDHLENRC